MTHPTDVYAYIRTLCASCLDGKISQLEERSAQQHVHHHGYTMSRHLGSHSRHQAPGTFGVVLGQVQLLLQLRIDRFADQA